MKNLPTTAGRGNQTHALVFRCSIAEFRSTIPGRLATELRLMVIRRVVTELGDRDQEADLLIC